jgi:hypothetical protein
MELVFETPSASYGARGCALLWWLTDGVSKSLFCLSGLVAARASERYAERFVPFFG